MKYGFIGCGNMGGAIARALSQQTKDILITDRSGKAKALADELGISYGDNETVARDCQRIFLAVKPFLMKKVLEPLKDILSQTQPVLITMAAGLSMEQIAFLAGSPLPIIRIMPNTPTAIGQGVIPYCHNDLVSQPVLEDWQQDMASCGLVDPLEERLMDAASALSGSGPAYMYLLLEALADGAVACGLPRNKAMDYAAMTMAGAAGMYLNTHLHPGALKDAVCSPSGSTIVALRELENHGFRGAAIDAVLAAYRKNQEMGK